MLKGIVTYKGEIVPLAGIRDRKRVAASRAYELGFVLGINEHGKKVFYDNMAGELVWPGQELQSQSVADPDNTAKTETPEQSPDTVSASDPDPGQEPTNKNPDTSSSDPDQEPDQKPESESNTPLTDSLLDLLNRSKSYFIVDTLSSIEKVSRFAKTDKGVLIELEKPESEKDILDSGSGIAS